MDKPPGFTLLEVLIVVAVLAILSAVAAPVFRGLLKNSELEAAVTGIVFDLKRARSNSMTGENGLRWGVRFNSATGSYYYKIFSSPENFSHVSTSIESTIYLPKQLIFIDPLSSSTKDIIFERIRGSVTVSSTISVKNAADNIQRTIIINTEGNVR